MPIPFFLFSLEMFRSPDQTIDQSAAYNRIHLLRIGLALNCLLVAIQVLDLIGYIVLITF